MGLSAELVTGNCICFCYVDDIGSSCFSFLFLAIFIHLSFACLWLGEKQSRFFMYYLESFGNLVAHSVLLFLVRVTLASLEVLFLLSNVSLKDGVI